MGCATMIPEPSSLGEFVGQGCETISRLSSSRKGFVFR